jgi:hypothetical protein
LYNFVQDIGDSRDSSTKEGEEHRLKKGISKQVNVAAVRKELRKAT